MNKTKQTLRTNLQFFAMKSLDLIQQERTEILARMSKAITENNAEEYAAAFNELATSIQECVKAEYEQAIRSSDATVLAQRGIRQLTSVEVKYYNSLIEAMKANDPKQAITLINDTLPKTVIDDIFTYLKENHPLLDEIDFRNTEIITQWLLSTTEGVAGWGDLEDEIKDELSASFNTVELGKFKVSAFIPVDNAMLDMGPAWLDNYVRTILAEAIAVALETAIVDGDGKNKPIGMTRKLTGAVDGVHPRKDAITVSALTPEVFGNILDTLTKAPNNKRRNVNSVIMVVNPSDYFTKVFPATTARTADGTFRNDVFPFPTKVIVSSAVPANHAVIGIGKKYFMGLGKGTNKGGKIEYADQTRFLEDQRLYRIKLYGNGRATDENAFVYCDITNIKPLVQKVEVTNIDQLPVV